jgi:hypothetical protein
MSYHGTQEPANDACMTKREREQIWLAVDLLHGSIRSTGQGKGRHALQKRIDINATKSWDPQSIV